MKPHAWVPLRNARRSSTSLPWPYCWHCGLVWLKNERTARLVRAPCPGAEED